MILGSDLRCELVLDSRMKNGYEWHDACIPSSFEGLRVDGRKKKKAMAGTAPDLIVLGRF